MTATRTTRPPSRSTTPTDKTAASHGCQWIFRRNAERQTTTLFPSHFSIIHYHASSFISTIHHHPLWTTIVRNHLSSSIIIRHHLSSSIIIRHYLSSSIIIHHHPSSSIIIHHHPSSSIIVYQHLSLSNSIHFPFISIYHHPWSYIIVHRRASWIIIIHHLYHDLSPFIIFHHHQSPINIHHDPLWTTIIHQHSFIIHHQHSPIWPCFGRAFFFLHCLPVAFQVGKHEAELRSLQHRGARNSVADPDSCSRKNCCLVKRAFLSVQQATWRKWCMWAFNLGLIGNTNPPFEKFHMFFETCDCLCEKNGYNLDPKSSGLNPLRQVSGGGCGGIGGSWWLDLQLIGCEPMSTNRWVPSQANWHIP